MLNKSVNATLHCAATSCLPNRFLCSLELLHPLQSAESGMVWLMLLLHLEPSSLKQIDTATSSRSLGCAYSMTRVVMYECHQYADDLRSECRFVRSGIINGG